MKNSDHIEELLEAYLRNELEGNALEEFNALLKQDSVLAEEVNRIIELNKVLGEDYNLTDFDSNTKKAKDYLNFYTDKKNKTYFNTLKSISNNHEKKTNNLRLIFRAVGVAALLVISFFIYNNFSKVDYNEVYATYMNTDDLPTLTTRGISNPVDSILHLIDAQFQIEAYDEVNDLIDYHSEELLSSNLDLVALYKGVSLLELEKNKQAYESFSNEDVFENSQYAQIAEWYKGLSLLKENDLQNAKEIFTEIAKDKSHIKQIEAKKILKKLK